MTPSIQGQKLINYQGYCTFLPANRSVKKNVNDRCLIVKINHDNYTLLWSNRQQMSINLNPASIDGNSAKLIDSISTSATVRTDRGKVGFCWNCTP